MPSRKKSVAAPERTRGDAGGKLERRVFNLTNCEVRAGVDGAPSTFVGYGAVYNELSVNLGGFRERIRSGTFDDALTEKQDVRFLINHDENLILGRTTSGTVELSSDERGLRVECPLPATSYARDLEISMARGDINQMSFGFFTRGDEWNDIDAESGLPIRDLTKADLFDVSVVTFPAYPDTLAEVRSHALEVKELFDLAEELGIDVRGAATIQNFPLAERDASFDAAAALERVRAHTGADDAPTDAYRDCFFVCDEEHRDDFAGYDLLYCDVVEGELRAVPAALASAAGATDTLAEEQRAPVRELIGAWYRKMAEAFDDATLVAPWDAPEPEPEPRTGKVLSAKHKDALTQAKGALSDASGAIQTVLDAATEATPAEEDSAPTPDNDEADNGPVSDEELVGGDDDTDEPATADTYLHDSAEMNGAPNFVAYRIALAAKRAEAIAEKREWDWDDDYEMFVLTQMLALGSDYMQVSPRGTADGMQAILQPLAVLVATEIAQASFGDSRDGRPDYISFRAAKIAAAKAEERDWTYVDDNGVYYLTHMISLGSCFMLCEEDPADVETMAGILRDLTALLSNTIAFAVEEAAAVDGEDAGASESRFAIERRRLDLLERNLPV